MAKPDQKAGAWLNRIIGYDKKPAELQQLSLYYDLASLSLLMAGLT